MKEQIREALDKATPSPWIKFTTIDGAEVFDPTNTYPLATLDFMNNHNDAHLIANSPEWLRWQNERIEQLEQQNKQLVEALENINTHVGNFTSTSFFHDAYIEVKQIANKALRGETP